MTTVTTVRDELRGGFDVAVRRGGASPGAWPNHRATPVLDERDTLIMSPALFARRPVRSPADVEGHLMLASETRPADWLEAAGGPHLAGGRRRVFDHFFIMRQAVEDGLGVGVGPLPMLDIDVASGRLMTPLTQISVRRAGYVALEALDADGTIATSGFVAWLAAERERHSEENR